MDGKTPPTTSELIIMIAGAVMLVASFLDFAFKTSAWGTYLFPVATLLPLYGVIMALQIALTKFANVNLPDRVAGFTWEQVHLVLGLLAGFMAIGWLITDLVTEGHRSLSRDSRRHRARGRRGDDAAGAPNRRDRLTGRTPHMNQTKLSPANIVILAAGAVMLVGSFLAFYSYSGFGVRRSFSAWSGANGFGIFGIATVIVLCGVVMAAQVAVVTFASGVSLPDKLLGLSWDQVHLALGFQATLMMLAFLIRSKGRRKPAASGSG